MGRKIDIYLASPYTHPDHRVEKWRYQRVVEAAALLLIQGYKSIYCPISHTHPIDQALRYENPEFHQTCRNHKFWVDGFDTPFLLASKRLAILTLPDWKLSCGILREIRIAGNHNIPVSLLIPIYDNDTRHLINIRWDHDDRYLDNIIREVDCVSDNEAS